MGQPLNSSRHHADLRPLLPGNSMVKFADDTYMIFPASNRGSCVEEIRHVGDWASSNNLCPNHVKSTEMPTCCGIPFACSSDHPKSQEIKALGVTKSRKFSVAQPVNLQLAFCGQSLFALRTLRHHVLPTDALHTVFQATVVDKLSYSSPAWWGLTSAADRDHPQYLYL